MGIGLYLLIKISLSGYIDEKEFIDFAWHGAFSALCFGKAIHLLSAEKRLYLGWHDGSRGPSSLWAAYQQTYAQSSRHH